jgi:amino acid transporter
MDAMYYIVYIMFFISGFAVYYVWNSNLYKNPKFDTILNLLTALTIIFTVFTIIIQLYTLNITQKDTEITFYQSIFDDLIEKTVNYFEENQDMNYYYNQMFHPLHYKDAPISKRNYEKEQQITRHILHKTTNILYYINNDLELSQNDKNVIERKLYKYLTDVMKSHIFIENYEHIKDTLYTPELVDYLQKKFQI